MYTLAKLNYQYPNPYTGVDSLSPDEERVNSTIGPLPKDKKDEANLEIERGEVVFHPNGNLMKATGKTHANGGTPVSLPENSFIFSNYKPLAISKQDKETFEFKKGGKYKQKNNTPAKVLEKEVDIEHHNRMVAIQKSPNYDTISKKSSSLMLEKNFKKAGQVAYLQEEKKGFPEGIPDFAEGTAPVNPNEEMQNNFMQLGGPLMSKKNKSNVYDPSAKMTGSTNWGPWPGDKLPIFQNQFGVSNAADKITDLDAVSQQLGYTGATDNQSFQNWLYNSSPLNKQIIDKWHTTYDEPNIGMPIDERNRFDGKIGIRWTKAIDEILKRTPNAAPNLAPRVPTNQITSPENPYAAPTPAPNDSGDTLPYMPEVPLTADQKLDIGLNAYNYANIHKYGPKRAQMNFTPVNLERINSQPYLNAINNQTQQAYKSNQAMNPYIARATNSNVYGRGLEQVSQTLGNISNQNSQISNQENLYNNQGVNNTQNKNVELDNNYYSQVQSLNQNYDNEKRFAGNRLMDKYLGYRSENDGLKFQLASQPTFGSIDVFYNPSTGETSKTPKPGFVARKQAAPLYDYNAKKNSIYYTGAGVDLNQLPTGTGYKDVLLQSLIGKFQNGSISQDELKALSFITGRMK